MKALKEFNIEIFGLSNKTHHFNFEFNDQFFDEFENSLVKKGTGACEVELIKTDSMITLNLSIAGSVELTCDRSLEQFDYPIESTKELVFKYGIEEKELSDDVYVILKDTQRINISDFLYQFISLEIPMKKLHPKYEGKDADPLIYQSDTEDEDENKVDPRWEALKKLK
jgi:uncharacterized metal-binding protein YceD (DUF177 family)